MSGRALGLRLVLAAALAWLYVGDAAVLLGVGRAEWAQVVALPSLALTAVGLLALGALVALTGWGLLGRRPASWPGFRWPMVGVVGLVCVDLMVLSPGRPGVAAEAAVREATVQLADTLRGPGDGLVVEPRALEEAALAVGPPPFVHHGQPLERFSVQLRRGCEGPSSALEGAVPGTVVVCVRGDQRRAWVYPVGLESTFGQPKAQTGPEWVEEVARGTPSPAE